jgi:hypothetical protein
MNQAEIAPVHVSMTGDASKDDEMNDRELVSVAVVRLHESARRLEALVGHTRSPALKLWLASLARGIEAHAERATIINAVAEDDPVDALSSSAGVAKAGTG